MCGILGAYHLGNGTIQPQLIQRAAHLMRHRGPDDEGYLLLNTPSGQYRLSSGPDTLPTFNHPSLEVTAGFTPNLIFAHRRLAIIDLSAGGHEPMTINDGRLWITFNGEIYNYLELRDELRALGRVFRTESDVEVLLHAYDQWGINCLGKLIGIFAFGLWDQSRQRLWCVRDHLGVKPLYYVTSQQSSSPLFAFASEIKALRSLDPQTYTPDMAQLAWYLQYGLVYNAPHTFFNDINELPGSHYLLVEGGKVQQPVRWWDVDLERVGACYDLTRPVDELRRLLENSVQLQLRSDVPVGTCLSGGLDSSSIVGLATSLLNGASMNSFSSIYRVKGMDERAYIDLVSNRYKTHRHEVTPSPDHYFADLERITWHQDIPTGTPTVYSQYAVMRLAHGKVTVLLDGQGADEMFGGYLSYVVYHLRSLFKQSPPQALPEIINFIAELRGRFNSALSLREFMARVMRFVMTGNRPTSLLNPDFVALAAQRKAEEHPVHTLRGAEPLNTLLYRALFLDSIPALLHYEDRNSMAQSIEARVPFLDHRLVEFSMAIPAHYKIRGPETKRILRLAMKDVLPPQITERKDKLGFPTPFSVWARGSLRNECESIIRDQVMPSGWFDPGKVEALWQRHLSGSVDASSTLHRLISANIWYRQATA
jgi:asparagine synthase (glutamine-hydrolysing)